MLCGLLQACAGHPGALREEAGESQQPVHGAQRRHAAAGAQGERAAQVGTLDVDTQCAQSGSRAQYQLDEERISVCR